MILPHLDRAFSPLFQHRYSPKFTRYSVTILVSTGRFTQIDGFPKTADRIGRIVGDEKLRRLVLRHFIASRLLGVGLLRFTPFNVDFFTGVFVGDLLDLRALLPDYVYDVCSLVRRDLGVRLP